VGSDAGDDRAGDWEGAKGEGGALGGEGRDETENWVSAELIGGEIAFEGAGRVGLDVERGRGVRVSDTVSCCCAQAYYSTQVVKALHTCLISAKNLAHTIMIGQFFTPGIVAECMFRATGVRKGQRVIDPSCGDGSFLRVAPSGVDLYGCEMDLQYVAVSQPLVSEGRFTHGDALTSLTPLWGTFDLAIGNPPFSAQTSLEKRDEVLRGFDLGAGRPSQCLEVLFIELFLKLVKTNGRIAVILPDGPFSNRPFQYVRKWLLCRAHVEAIISLPRGIFSKTTAKTSILIAKKLPTASQPYRELTALLECGHLDELNALKLSAWKKIESRWRSVVLADQEDWRPESLPAQGTNEEAPTVRLGDLFRLRTGHAAYAAKRELLDTGGNGRVVLIRAKNIAPGGGLRLDSNCAYISRSGEMFREQSMVQQGEILFVRVGAGCFGRTALISEDLEAQADDWIHVLTPIVSVNSKGLFEWFNSDQGQAAIRRIAKGVGTMSVSKSSLAELRVPAQFKLSDDLALEGVAPVVKGKRRRLTALLPG
jgi:type I restriction enzyme M protein